MDPDPQGGGSLIGVKAEAADESGIRQRLTATRMFTMGVFSLAAPKKKGTGNAYVVIEGPQVSGVATIAADKSGNAGPAAFSVRGRHQQCSAHRRDGRTDEAYGH